jgi:arabinose-5-phosphate isomerase
MHTGDEVPRVGREATISTALVEMSRKRLGMTAVVDDAGRLVGVFTDGDLRRTLDNPQLELRSTSVTSVMNRTPKSIGPNRLASEAARLMEEHRISALLVIDDQERLVGALNIHDLLRAKVV